MDKFFATLCALVFSVLVFSISNFKQHSSANTTLEVAKVMIGENVSRSPAIVNNR